LGQPVRQASALSREGSTCHLVKGRKKEKKYMSGLGWQFGLVVTQPGHPSMGRRNEYQLRLGR